MPTRVVLAPVLLLAFLVPGCGGGGGGGGGPVALAPAGLSYLAPAPFTVGVPIAALVPTLGSGDAPTFSVAPTLPAGLVLDPATGTIDGVPSAPSPATLYTITATNPGGTTTFDLTLEVLAPFAPTLVLATPTIDVLESAGTIDITVLLSAATTAPVGFTLAAGVATATAGIDHDFTAALPVTVPAGDTSATVTIGLLDDPVDESDETFVIRIESPTGASIAASDTVTITILDDDPTPQASFANAAQGASEGAVSIDVDLVLDRPAATDRTVSLAITGDATAPGDFASLPTTALFPAGSTATTLTLTPVDDAVFEGDESVTLTILPGGALEPGATPATTITLLEDDAPPTVELTGGGTTITEGDPAATLVIALSAVADVPVDVAFSVDGSATPGIDHGLVAGTITFLPGEVSKTLSVEPFPDGLVEPDEAVVVALLSANPGALGPSAEATVTIADSPVPPPTVNVTGGGTILEGTGLVNIDVVLSDLSPVPVSVTYDLSGTATAGVDFPPPANPVIIPAGALSASITVEPLDDGTPEGPETVDVTLLSATGGVLGTNLTATVTIEEPPVPTVTLGSGGAIAEDAAPFAIAVTLSVPAPEAVVVDFSLGGTATDGIDFAASASPLTIPAGATVTTLTIDPFTDGILEGPETVEVTVTGVSGGGAVLGGAFVATVVIDDPVLPTVGLTGAGQTRIEGGAPIVIGVELSAPTSSDVVVDFAFAGTASPGSDYLPTISPVAIIAGTTSTAISIAPLADTAVEGNETVIVQILTASGATIGAASSAQVTIEDDTSVQVPPAGLAYSQPFAIYAPGVPIAPNVPTLASGGADTWSSVPILPFGLALDPTTGVITGSPLIDQPVATYTITAANALGQTTATIEIGVGTDFVFDMPSLTVPYDVSTGAANFDVPLTIEEMLGNPTGAIFSPVHAISAGILFDEDEIVAIDVQVGSALIGFDGGNGPEFYLTTPVAGGGMTFGIIISFSQSESLLADGPQEWAAVTFVPNQNFLVGDPDGATVAITWQGPLGPSSSGNLVVYGTQQSLSPQLDDAVIEFTP